MAFESTKCITWGELFPNKCDDLIIIRSNLSTVSSAPSDYTGYGLIRLSNKYSDNPNTYLQVDSGSTLVYSTDTTISSDRTLHIRLPGLDWYDISWPKTINTSGMILMLPMGGSTGAIILN